MPGLAERFRNFPAYPLADVPELKRRLAAEGVDVDPYREVLPLIGSKEGIAHLALAYVNPGDATIVPDPGYQPYVGGTLLAGGEPYLAALRPGDVVDVEVVGVSTTSNPVVGPEGAGR